MGIVTKGGNSGGISRVVSPARLLYVTAEWTVHAGDPAIACRTPLPLDAAETTQAPVSPQGPFFLLCVEDALHAGVYWDAPPDDGLCDYRFLERMRFDGTVISHHSSGDLQDAHDRFRNHSKHGKKTKFGLSFVPQ